MRINKIHSGLIISLIYQDTTRFAILIETITAVENKNLVVHI